MERNTLVYLWEDGVVLSCGTSYCLILVLSCFYLHAYYLLSDRNCEHVICLEFNT
jgi:hypothetical protein